VNSPAVAPPRSMSFIKPSHILYLYGRACARELAVKNAMPVELHRRPFLGTHSI
jgi:hypothetical protein